MKKPLFLLLSTIGLINTAFAIPAPSFNGFYAGAAVGGAFTQAGLSGATSTQFINFLGTDNNINPLLPDSHKNSVAGDIHLGYGHQLGQSPLYLGAEVFGDFANREMNNAQTNIANENVITNFPPLRTQNGLTNSVATATNVKLNTAEFGVDLHPGILFGQNTLLSAIVGVAFNKLQISSNNMQVTTYYQPYYNPAPTISSALQASASKNVAALRLGGELQEHFNNHWALTADYIYTDYGKISTSAAGNVDYSALFFPTLPPGTVVLPFTTNASACVTSNTITLGLNYYFSANQEAATNLTSATFTSSPFDGFYAGAAVGGTFTQADLSGSTSAQYFDPSAFVIENNINPLPSDLHNNSVLGDVHLGYGHQLGQSPLYLGAEVFGDFANREMNNTQTNIANDMVTFFFPPPPKSQNGIISSIATTTNVKLNTVEYGVDLHPGILLGQNTLLSGIVGVAFNKLQISSNNMQVTSYNNPAHFGPVPTISSNLLAAASKNVAALRLGGEVEEHFNNHLALTADYVYTNYGKISTSAAENVDYSATRPFSPPAPPLMLPFSANVSANVHSNTVMLGLNYYFSGSQQAT